MLALAKARAAVTGTRIELGIGDIRDIPFKDGSFDLVSCLRFLNWVDAEGVQQAVRELARVSGDKLLLGIRYFPPLSELKRYPFSMVRLGMRALGVAHVHAYRTGLRFQHKMTGCSNAWDWRSSRSGSSSAGLMVRTTSSFCLGKLGFLVPSLKIRK